MALAGSRESGIPNTASSTKTLELEGPKGGRALEVDEDEAEVDEDEAEVDEDEAEVDEDEAEVDEDEAEELLLLEVVEDGA
jgi:hypothetical protein